MNKIMMNENVTHKSNIKYNEKIWKDIFIFVSPFYMIELNSLLEQFISETTKYFLKYIYFGSLVKNGCY